MKIKNQKQLNDAYIEKDILWDEYDGTCLNPRILEIDKAIDEYNGEINQDESLETHHPSESDSL